MEDIEDTICALSTPPGRSGIAIVRLSGKKSFSIIRRIFNAKDFQGEIAPRRAILGRIIDPRNGSEIDEAMTVCFTAPNSYTCEDMVEFSIHGSPVLIAALLDCLCASGARLAEPGEFTMRAFLHGRIDLTQAEAIHDIIEANTLYQAQVAGRQRSGELALQLSPMKEQLLETIMHLESDIEFSEENPATDSREEIMKRLTKLRQSLLQWIDSYRKGRIIRDGFSLTIIGRPNVGKSSIFNALLQQRRSIVTEIPGTTRDLVSEIASIGGVPVRLQDTAGIHDSANSVEKLGIDKSFEAISDADAILLVVDTSAHQSKQDWVLRQQISQLSCIVAMNKSDLPSKWSHESKTEFAGDWPFVETSAKTEFGVDTLREVILNNVLGLGRMQSQGLLVTNLRHCQTLEAVEKYLMKAMVSMQQGMSEEFILIDLSSGLKKLGEITGETTVEDLLDKIFAKFCIGK